MGLRKPGFKPDFRWPSGYNDVMKPAYVHSLPEFNSSICVYYCSPKSMEAVMADGLEVEEMKAVKTALDSSSGYFIATEQGTHFIWVGCGHRSPESLLNILTHEAYHAVRHIDEHHGLESEEYCAYLLGDIVARAFAAIKGRLPKS